MVYSVGLPPLFPHLPAFLERLRMKPIHMIAVIACTVLAAPPAHADSRAREVAKKKLQDAAKGGVEFSSHRATGAARFVKLAPCARGLGKGLGRPPSRRQDRAAAPLP